MHEINSIGINRKILSTEGGGNVLLRVYNSLPNEEMDYESD